MDIKIMIELMEMTMFPMMKGMLTDIPGTIEMILPILDPEILCGLIRWLFQPGVLIDVIRFMMDMMMGAMK
ncbi:MAG: hypothetical protein EF806_01340 [Candidatus Methanoliparum thermophilum]|uniref:Uncharacterized protein n=1 Tax=Methanoliparum thermophilum TaxID=2491083 RepID=A0A520KT93_METT2|nr:hypothetical protein [Candidatus Methanoliparum sp. LAM-1]RZN65188.1 MAG: hypothetical protein EF806_01340 [Candidatus Methanoliparum thermophilum]BDC36628.1 hypothetical protein MTLP_13100 [Candidatus Methanoliparum sp. LAM-1]